MPRTRLVVVLMTALLTALLVQPADAAPHGGPKVVDAYAGFRTKGVGAGGGYLGARQLGASVVYRIDPARKRAATEFGAFEATTRLTGGGKRKVTTSDTQRAAWIISKYGAFPKKVQGAAVELALDDLLVGGSYALDGRTTRKRLAAIGRPGKVVSFAKQLLTGSRLRAGDYAVTISAPASADLGAPVTATVAVEATSSGLGIASLPVTLSMPGSAPQSVETNDAGVATATLTAGQAGPVDLTATVSKVPENRLLVATPTDPKASRVAVAQVKSTRTVSRPVAVRAAPGLAIDTFNKNAARPTGAGALVGVTGAFFGVALRATLYGPNFGPSCTGTVQRVIDFNAPNDFTGVPGSNDPVPSDGYYTWKVETTGNAYNQPASQCGGSILVQTPG